LAVRTESAKRTWIGISPISTTGPVDEGPDTPAPGFGPISFLSDYGLEDEFVGVVHRVIAGLAPGVRVVDINHNVAPHDVRFGALTLWRTAPWLAPGVILAVVDPGVGTNRRPVAITVSRANVVLVGPDNGLLLPAALHLGPITAAVELDQIEIDRGATFAGRDLFAPAAARIATGADPNGLGVAIDPQTLQGEPVPSCAREMDGSLRTEVLWVDRFGNVQLNAGPREAGILGAEIDIRTHTGLWQGRLSRAYAELQPDELGLIRDSYDLMSISLNAASAAELTGAVPGDTVWLSRRAGGEAHGA
jgi:S-adenosyl-L-methionine hydrolase (adenosine-forming)